MPFSAVLLGLMNNYGYFRLDSWYLILVVPAMLISLLASISVRKTFDQFNRWIADSGHTGQSAARKILNQNGLTNVVIERVAGNLTDHYDPRAQRLRLSEATYDSSSIAAIGVAAHEAGHAIQQSEGFWANSLRGTLLPVARIGSTVGPYLAVFGLILQISVLTDIGIVLFSAAVLFYLVTLPVEFDASRRAIRVLEDQEMLTADELTGARRVLRAAAMTYVASALLSFASLLRLILLARGRSDRR